MSDFLKKSHSLIPDIYNIYNVPSYKLGFNILHH